MPICGCRARISCAARRPSSVCVGGIRMSTIATSGSCSSTSRSSSSARAACATTSIPARRQERGDALAHEQAVVGDHDAHGSSAVTTVPAPGRAGDAQAAVERLDAVGEAAQAGAARGVGAADAVVGDLDDGRRAGVRDTRTRRRRSPARTCRRWPAPRRRRSTPRARPARAAGRRRRTTTAVGTGERAASESSAAARPWSSTAGWMPRASSRSSASDSASSLARGGDELLAPRRVARMRPCEQPQLQRQRDEPLLGAVVQVALEPAALGVAGRDDALARRLQLGEPRLGLGVQALVLERDRRRGADRLDQLGVVVERRVVDERRHSRPSRSTGATARSRRPAAPAPGGRRRRRSPASPGRR